MLLLHKLRLLLYNNCLWRKTLKLSRKACLFGCMNDKNRARERFEVLARAYTKLKELCETHDHKACRYRLGAARCRSDGKGLRICRRVANRYNVACIRSNKADPNDLGGTRGSANKCIGELCAVLSQHKLSCLGYTCVKEDLIRACFGEDEFGIRGPADIRVEYRTVFGEGNVRPRCNRSCIVGRHKCVKLCIAQHASGDTLWAL